jgi:MoaA/NifB/PqqE/SkfB family radical SAM enzyme
MDGLIAVTYRCNAHCVKCNTWCHPSQPTGEITVADLRTLPALGFGNVTGGEPFLRDDIADIVSVLGQKAKRVVVNMGLANYVQGEDRLLPCGVAEDLFFVGAYGEVRPCNAMEETMGSLKQRSFDEIWASPEVQLVRSHASSCTRSCWMIGSVAPAMKKNIRVPAARARSSATGRRAVGGRAA